MGLGCKASALVLSQAQVDFQGNATRSASNFTDLDDDYEATDWWSEIKFAYWLDEAKSFSPFISFVPTGTTHDVFWYQRYTQMNIGVQWYPLATLKLYETLKAVRFFTQYSRRFFYDMEPGQDLQDEDFQFGFDYYYDNIFDDQIFTVATYMSTGFKKTGFNRGLEYEAFFFSGDARIGPKQRYGQALLFPYILLNWSFVPDEQERWFENYFRVGGGLRWYPMTKHKEGLIKNIMERFYFYGEIVYNACWLKDTPDRKVEDTDFRFGIAFSTGGFFRDHD